MYTSLRGGGGGNRSFTTFQHYIGYYSSHYIHTFIVHTEERKERQNSDTERLGTPPHTPWLCYVPGVQLRCKGSTCYVPIGRTKLGKSCRCLRTPSTQRSGWYSNPVFRVLKSVPLPLTYRGSHQAESEPTQMATACRNLHHPRRHLSCSGASARHLVVMFLFDKKTWLRKWIPMKRKLRFFSVKTVLFCTIRFMVYSIFKVRTETRNIFKNRKTLRAVTCRHRTFW